MNLATVHVHVFYQLCVISLTVVSVCSYNVEVEKVGFAKGKNGSQFGYTVAIVKKPGWTESFMKDVPFIQKVLLVGAPNETYDNIHGHGQVHSCFDPQKSSTVNCESLNITDETNTCGVRFGVAEVSFTQIAASDSMHGGEGQCKGVGQYIMDPQNSSILVVGGSLTTRRYVVRDHCDVRLFQSVCAPAWKNVFPEPSIYHNFMIGMCLKVRDDLRTIRCDQAKTSGRLEFKYCWPFWPTRTTTSINGQQVYAYAEAGMAVAFTENGNEVISGPGTYNWKGAYYSFGEKWLKDLSNLKNISTLYFGYSLAVGKLRNANVVAGVPNWHSPFSGVFGRVEMYQNTTKSTDIEFGLPLSSTSCKDIAMVPNMNTIIDKEQTGSKFGATVETIDITGDGFDEIFVSSPLYSGHRPDEGRVFVYTTTKTHVCGPIGILSGGASENSLKDMSAFARFGSSIAPVGDLNKDGYTDIAIGAPYEDNGSGAIYIYHGIGDCNCVMEDKFSQRIAGSLVSPSIKSFGWSIYGNEDVDDNSYPDLAVGAYQSDAVFMFRTKPIVKLMVELKITPAPIPLDGKLLDCSQDKVDICFEVIALFQYESLGTRMGNVSEISFTWSLRADTLYKSKEGNSRITFRQNNNDVLMENITLNRKGSDVVSKTYIMDVKGFNNKPEPRDPWTLVRMEGNFELLGTNGADFQDLDAVLSENSPTQIIENVEFYKPCESIELCTADLKINVDMFLLKYGRMPMKVDNDTIIYVDEADVLEVIVDVQNLDNSSYRANFSGDVTSLMRRDVMPNNGIIGATCKYESPLTKSETMMNCTADSKLDKNENFKVKFYFDISRVRLLPYLKMEKMLKSIQLNYKAEQINHDINGNNNMFKREIAIRLKYDVTIEEDKEISAQERYSADTASTRKIRVIHRYYITNNGPSFVPYTFVNITIPTKHGDSTIATVLRNNLPNSCQLRGHEAVVQTTTTAKTTTENVTIPDTEAQKRSRPDVPPQDKPNAGESTTKSKTVQTITCLEGTGDCDIVECRISNLEKNEQETVEVTVDLYEKELGKDKDVRVIRYISKATVTDPNKWYGGKVVPWKDILFAEKQTLLVVEMALSQGYTASVVNEVNIWIIVGAVLGAIAFLVIVIIILYRCGFFNRKKHSEVQQWKRARLYNQNSMPMLKSANQPYNDLVDTVG